ncbi:MAG: transglutaminase domain-containing protein, partial [Pseudomonadota bacterium]|nr:transglutaminase domain-containing protein [Pseudomonadota bacterium]
MTHVALFTALLCAYIMPVGAETETSLQKIAHVLTQLQNQLDTPTARRRDASTSVDTYLAALEQQRSGLEQLKQQQQAYFEQVEAHILNHELPETILQRHQQNVAQFHQDWVTLENNLNALLQADSSQLRRRTTTTLEQLQLQTSSQAPADNLYIPQQPVRPPLKTPEALKQLLRTPIQVAATSMPAGLLRTRATLPGQNELAATPTVQLTEAIQNLAQSLNHNPVEIYRWVYNHIQFIPTYGATQGAQLTLETRQGNAFDTTTLLIALLRAANIHARYVYGSVQIPIDKVRNWLGDLESAEAAVQLLNQGGIPASAVTEGGKIIAITLEHVWAEAF